MELDKVVKIVIKKCGIARFQNSAPPCPI